MLRRGLHLLVTVLAAILIATGLLTIVFNVLEWTINLTTTGG